MNEKLPALREAIKQLETNEETDLAEELTELVERLSIQLEKKELDDITETEENIEDFLYDHEDDIQISGWQEELASLKVGLVNPDEKDKDDTNAVSAEKQSSRAKFRKRTGITAAIVGLGLLANKAMAATPSHTPDIAPENTSARFQSPTEKVYPISSPFGATEGRDHVHQGVDLAMPEATPLFAIRPGVVKKNDFQASGAGHYIVIDHGDGRESKYFHLQQKSPLTVGMPVDHETMLGLSGNTGHSEGPHLHLELWKDGKAVDPTHHCPLDGKGKINI